MKEGIAGAFMFESIEKKYNLKVTRKNTGQEFHWQWFFPAKAVTYVTETGEYRRAHLHDRHVQKAIKAVVRRTELRTVDTFFRR